MHRSDGYGLLQARAVTPTRMEQVAGPRVDSIQHARLGRLILGFGFLRSDLACYAQGVPLGMLIERMALADQIPRRS